MSMTREEAIEFIDRLKRSCHDLAVGMPEEPGWILREMALNMALSALRPVSREQVEKVWRGEWEYHPEDYDELTWTCSRCGEVWTLIDGTPDDNNMDFCPACGAPMTDEAVDMVMERMEALKDAES